MSSPFVTFPGTSGNYVFTEDVNLFDADTAHLQQSIGGWKNNSGSTITSTPQTPPVAPPFGSTALKVTKSSAAGSGCVIEVGRTAGKPTIDVDASTEYTTSVWMYTDFTSSTEDAFLRVYDMTGGSPGGSTSGSKVSLVAGAWTEVKVTRTTAAGVDGCLLLCYLSEVDADVDAVFYVASCTVRQGSDASFVPSLRIVGDLDMRAKLAPTDATPTASEYILNTASGSDGYGMYLGTDGKIYVVYGDGSSNRSDASDALTWTDGDAHEVKYTMDVSSGATAFYFDGAAAGTGTETVAAGTPGGLDLLIGCATSSTLLLDGDIYYAEVRDGIGGPVVARFDAADVARQL